MLFYIISQYQMENLENLVQEWINCCQKSITNDERKKELSDNFNSTTMQNFLNTFVQNEEMKKSLQKEMKKYPLLCNILFSESSKGQKTTWLKTALQKQQDAYQKMETTKLDDISTTMLHSVKELVSSNPTMKDFIVQNQNFKTISIEQKKDFFQQIVNMFSKSFRIQPPKLYTDGLTIRWLGTSSFIKVDGGSWEIGNLFHEYTHYLQNNGRTSSFEAVQQSQKRYCWDNLFQDDPELNWLAKQVYDTSLMEQEAEYVAKKTNDQLMKDLTQSSK